ncbi:G5 domain-containing protein [Bacillus timonensis]|nr:G5 domain-containing protein [Bacillus timonensis]
MNYKFKAKLFTLLTVSLVFIFSFSHLGAATYTTYFSDEIFKEGTKIGNVDVSGLTKKEAKMELVNKITDWTASGQIVFIYGDEMKTMQKTEALEFNFELSIDTATNGINNAFLVDWRKDNINKVFQELTQKDISEFNEEKLKLQLLDSASKLIPGELTLNLVSFIKVDENNVISKVNIQNTNTNTSFGEIGEMLLPANESFSLLQFIENFQDEYTNEELSLLATGIYELIIPTNFKIVERHTSSVLPAYAKLGFEALVEKGQKDLIIYNPNPFEYRISITVKENELQLELIGAQLLSEYKSIIEEEAIKPKTIKQFESTLSEGKSYVKKEGENGFYIKVIRQILKNGVEEKREIISEDYYSPIHKIEVYSLASSQSQNQNGSDSSQPPSSSDTAEDNDAPIITPEDELWEQPDEMK